jgi:hypothetical protein
MLATAGATATCWYESVALVLSHSAISLVGRVLSFAKLGARGEMLVARSETGPEAAVDIAAQIVDN